MEDSTPAAPTTGTTTTESTSTASAPASSASSTTVNGPMSASDALAFADSSLATPETAVDTPAPAVTAPTASDSATTPASDDKREPFIPRARFDEENVRRKTAENDLRALEWAKGVSAEEGQVALNLARSLSSDPVQTALQLLQGLEGDPQYAEAIRSRAAQILGRRQQAADAEPEADLQAQDGTLVYSADRLKAWREWNNRQLTASLTKDVEAQIAPLRQMAKSHQQLQDRAQATNTVMQVMTEFKQAYPDFTDAHKSKVAAAINADPRLQALVESDPSLALETAWHRVYRAEVLPSQQKQSEAAYVASLQQRAMQGTVNPSAAAPVTPKSTIGDARAALMAAGVD